MAKVVKTQKFKDELNREKVSIYMSKRAKKRLRQNAKEIGMSLSAVVSVVAEWLSVFNPDDLRELVGMFQGIQEMALKKYGKDVLLVKISDTLREIKYDIMGINGK